MLLFGCDLRRRISSVQLKYASLEAQPSPIAIKFEAEGMKRIDFVIRRCDLYPLDMKRSCDWNRVAILTHSQVRNISTRQKQKQKRQLEEFMKDL